MKLYLYRFEANASTTTPAFMSPNYSWVLLNRVILALLLFEVFVNDLSRLLLTSSSDASTAFLFVSSQSIDLENTTDTIINDIYSKLPKEQLEKLQFAAPDKLIKGDYIIRFNETMVDDVRAAWNETLSNQTSDVTTLLNVTKAWKAIKCIKFQFQEALLGLENETDATKLERKIEILRVFLESDLISVLEEDAIINMTQTTTSDARNASTNISKFELNQFSPTWGLDRIDQLDLPLDNNYHANFAGQNVTALIIDTGINPNHEEFFDTENNLSRASCQFSGVPDEDCIDGNGHGTHVSGTIGSKTYGVAKKITLIGIKVLGTSGSGSSSTVIDGLNFALQKIRDNPDKRFVVNMSLGGGSSQSLDRAVDDLLNAGAFVAIAAGNSDEDACISSPGRNARAVTVASSDRSDQRSSFSNHGPCVDIFAPGSDITSTWFDSNTAINTISGTSMATPHIVGVAALYWSAESTITNDMLTTQLISDATNDTLSDTKGSPNRLVNTEAMFTTSPQAPLPSSGATRTLSISHYMVGNWVDTAANFLLLLLVGSLLCI